MKKPIVFVVTFLIMLLSVNAVFAERDVTGSEVTIDPAFITANPFYTPGDTYTIPFFLNNASADGAEITSVTLDFPAGVTVELANVAASIGGASDPVDFVGTIIAIFLCSSMYSPIYFTIISLLPYDVGAT